MSCRSCACWNSPCAYLRYAYQPSKKRKHEPYKAWLLKIYGKNPRLNAHEFGERLAEHVNSNRSAVLSTKPPPGKASAQLGQRQEKGCSQNQGEVSEQIIGRRHSQPFCEASTNGGNYIVFSILICTKRLQAPCFWRVIGRVSPSNSRKCMYEI
jgi:hypothetical protein